MSKIIPEFIRVASISVYKAAVDTSDEYLDYPVKFENIDVAYGQDSAYNIEEKAVRVRLQILLKALDQENMEIGLKAEYGIEFHFTVDNINDFIDNEGENLQVKGQLWGTLMSIAFSTARGIVFDRTQGTFFGGVILPVIDPKKLAEEL